MAAMSSLACRRDNKGKWPGRALLGQLPDTTRPRRYFTDGFAPQRVFQSRLPELKTHCRDRSSPGTARSRIVSGHCRTETIEAHFARQFLERGDPILGRGMGRE
jgi:hypothetical protein